MVVGQVQPMELQALVGMAMVTGTDLVEEMAGPVPLTVLLVLATALVEMGMEMVRL